MTSDTKQKASIILNKALKFGVEKGRLRLGKAGKHVQRYRLSMKGARKQIIMQYNRNKKLVEFDTTYNWFWYTSATKCNSFEKCGKHAYRPRKGGTCTGRG